MGVGRQHRVVECATVGFLEGNGGNVGGPLQGLGGVIVADGVDFVEDCGNEGRVGWGR